MKMKKVFSCLCLFAYLIAFTSCATYQPIRPRVVLHPTGYENSVTSEGISIAAIPFNPKRSMYSDPNDPSSPKPTHNLLEAGVCPVRLIFVNESNEPIIIDPSQITCTDTAGTMYQPFNESEAGDAIEASQAFQSWVKGAVAGAVVGSLLGAALGAAIGGAIGGRDAARRGAVIGGVSGGASGAAEGGMAVRIQMERGLRLMLARDHLKGTTLYPGMRHEGIVLFPSVNMQAIQILLTDSEYQQPRQIEIPIHGETGTK